ncbi:hypothetical protein DD238_002725 [Peronospora effusa]|uniref:Sulfatase N-terminal domain-containing protein n=1 Tax=Peronospora effusa TaxID=542832 RepID=A0A3M6VTQ6_9STRA|nr:hypothetical protein DD238_002725 [Peronospora effusa]
MYGDANDNTFGTKVQVTTLGFMEDFVCTTYLGFTLWAFDLVKQAIQKHFKYQGGRDYADFQKQKRLARLASRIVTFAVSWPLSFVMMMPFVCDILLVRHKQLRFSMDILLYAYHERAFIREAPISKEEFHAAFLHLFFMAVAATFIATVRSKTRWADLSNWNPMHLVVNFTTLRLSRFSTKSIQHNGQSYEKVQSIGDASHRPVTPTTFDTNYVNELTTPDKRRLQIAILFITLIAFPLFVVGASRSSSALVAYSALNMTLNQVLMQALLPVSTRKYNQSSLRPWTKTFIHTQTEEHELFGNSLFRRTLGFRGDLAFNVTIDSDDSPNVILIALEAARFHNSRYLVGESDPSNLFKGTNITISPNFDKWAKRGISFSNMWSSHPSSRGLESVLFGQVPYNHKVTTGIAGGRADTKPSGLPQLFLAKEYETFFMTGAGLGHDQWNIFLAAHGFETVYALEQMKALAESDLGIRPDEWLGPAWRQLGWGVHDDLNFQLLGNLLVNKTKEQNERMAKGEPKKPLFLMQYTVSSHEPFRQRPKWYADMKKPDFSALYAGHDRRNVIKNYMEIQYFVDMELGKFMDRMEQEGILNNTIVVIFGDHGRGVEYVNSDMRDVSVTRVPATIIAEGRLGKYAGLIIDDATEHYDLLNTLADITGLPDGGFLQHGVGRSLKRKAPFGERVVFSNNPIRKMAIVRGHERLQYDQDLDSVLLHNADTDHDMQVDLFPHLTTKEKKEWLEWRDIGRDISQYYIERWDNNCLFAVNCTNQ